MFKVYVGGLYLESPSKDAGDPGGRPGESHLHAFPARTHKGAARRGLAGRLRGECEGQAWPEARAFDKMFALIPDVKEGDTLTFTYLPAKGTTLQVGNKELGVFARKGFSDAVFSIFWGPKPPSDDLQKGMLGL